MTVLNEYCKKIFCWIAGRNPFHIVIFAFCLVVLYTITAIIINPVYTRDASEYVALVEAFKLGAYERAFQKHLPVLYTILAGGIAKCGILSSVQSLVLISGLATALTVFPLFGILKKFVTPQLAALGALLFILFPKIIECGVSPLLDSGRFLFFATALWIIFSVKENFNPIKTLFLGIVFACLTLVRAEGILFVFILLFIHVLHTWYITDAKTLSNRIGRMLITVLLPLIVCGLLITPRLIQMYNLTGYPVIDSRQSNAVKGLIEQLYEKSTTSVVSETPIVKKIVSYENNGGNNISINVNTILNQPRFYHNFVRSFFYMYLPFTLLGILTLWKRRKFTYNEKLLLLLFLLYNLLHFLMRAGAARYFLLNVCLVMPFTLHGAKFIWQEIEKRTKWVYLLMLPILFGGVFTSFYSMKHMNEDKERCIKTIKKYFPAHSERNATVDRPVVLLVGSDYGIGYYADVNVIWYPRLGLNQLRTIEDIAVNGVDSVYAQYWQTKEIPKWVYIDAIVVDTKKCDADLKICRSLFHEYVKVGYLMLFFNRNRMIKE